MIDKLLGLALNIFTLATNIILVPINAYIREYLPSVIDSIIIISDFFVSLKDIMIWCVSFSGLSQYAIDLIIAYYIFKLTVPHLASTFKLVLKWWDTLVA